MFYLLCICLVLAVMFAVFALAVLACAPLLGMLARRAHRLRPGTAAHLLFIFRALPLVLAITASLGFALPAFLEFEPYSTREMPGPALWALAGLGLLIVLAIAWRCWRILRLTLRLQRNWLKNATPLAVNPGGIPVFCVNGSASLVAVAGIFVPRIFVSQDVVDALNQAELQAALSHEWAHIDTGDNLRQLVLKVTRAPGLWQSRSKIDSLWASMSELAADERALARGASPLDLSSALVKVGRLAFQRRPALLAASHLVDGCGSATLARAGRLRDLLEQGFSPEQTALLGHRSYLYLGSIAFALFMYLFAVMTVLPAVHDVLEFIVR
jgi:Zn-dependent protease with chaperone function